MKKLLAILLSLATPGYGAWSYVGGTALTYASSACTGSRTVTSGNLLVIMCYEGTNNFAITCSDDKSNTYGNGATATTGSKSFGLKYVSSAASGVTNFTCSDYTNWPGSVYCIVHEYSGQAASPYDTGSGSVVGVPAGNGNVTTGNASLSETGELVVSMMCETSVHTVSAQSGTERVYNAFPANYCRTQDTTSGSGSYASTWTISAYYDWGAVQGAFKASGGGGGGTLPRGVYFSPGNGSVTTR